MYFLPMSEFLKCCLTEVTVHNQFTWLKTVACLNLSANLLGSVTNYKLSLLLDTADKAHAMVANKTIFEQHEIF